MPEKLKTNFQACKFSIIHVCRKSENTRSLSPKYHCITLPSKDSALYTREWPWPCITDRPGKGYDIYALIYISIQSLVNKRSPVIEWTSCGGLTMYINPWTSMATINNWHVHTYVPTFSSLVGGWWPATQDSWGGGGSSGQTTSIFALICTIQKQFEEPLTCIKSIPN